MAKRILVADDDKEIREIISFVLDRHGFVVEAASNGLQLRQMLASCLPDLIILDIMMPGIDGYRLCAELRSDSQTRAIPIIMMTAHAEGIYQRISEDLGVEEHMTKPFHPLELAEKVVALLGKV
jgi:CheY-like chemotaxis protein